MINYSGIYTAVYNIHCI